MSDVDINKAIEDHRNSMIMSKQLSDFQLNNLKAWSMIVFDSVEKCEIDYNFMNEDGEFSPGAITFDFTFKETPSEESKKKAIENLTNWSTFLFFNETKIIVKENGKLLNE